MYKDVFDVYVHRFEGMRGVYVAERPKKAIVPSTTDPDEFMKNAEKYGVHANRNWIEFNDGVVVVEGHCDDTHLYFDNMDKAIEYWKAV